MSVCRHDPMCPGWPRNQSCPETKPSKAEMPDLLAKAGDELRKRRIARTIHKTNFEKAVRDLCTGMGDALLEDPSRFGPSDTQTPVEILNTDMTIMASILFGKVEREQYGALLGLVATQAMAMALYYEGEWPR